MAHTPPPAGPPAGTTKPAKPGRDDRLKAALKANMARRKAQARARSTTDGVHAPQQAEKSAPREAE